MGDSRVARCVVPILCVKARQSQGFLLIPGRGKIMADRVRHRRRLRRSAARSSVDKPSLAASQ
ncbi:MAG: hypothetical protein Tsb0016_03010 [Sphingomonadales bacterium]